MKGEEILYCDSCQRILYFVPPPPKEEEGQAADASNGAPADAPADEAAAQ
jgi:hypothetical protein